MVEAVRRELDRYSRTRRFSKSLRQPLSTLAFCPQLTIKRIDELEHLILLWRGVAFHPRPGRKIATRYLTLAFRHLSGAIHALLAVDKSKVDPVELLDLKDISPEIVAEIPDAAKRIAEEGVAFLETQSQSCKRISDIRFLWLETLRHLEAFIDDDRVREPRGQLVRELNYCLASPRLHRPDALKMLETLAKLEPDSEPNPLLIRLPQWIVDHPLSRNILDRALCLQVRPGLENEDDAECILDSWSFSIRGRESECDGGSEGRCPFDLGSGTTGRKRISSLGPKE
jgi:hypothetical protein